MTPRYEPHICEGAPCKFLHLHSPLRYDLEAVESQLLQVRLRLA